MSAILKQTETLQQQAVRELHEEVRAECLEREGREREYCYQVTRLSLEAIGYASEAGTTPRVSLPAIRDALRCLRHAQTYAELLQDMEES